MFKPSWCSQLLHQNVRYIRSIRGSRETLSFQPLLDIESHIRQFPEEQLAIVLRRLHQLEMQKFFIKQWHKDNPQPENFQRLEKESNNKKLEGKFLAGLIEQSLIIHFANPEELDLPFWISVRRLASIALKAKNPEYLDLFGVLFEAARHIKDPSERMKSIYTTGRYIYRFKQIRLNPASEIEFLDSLVAHNRLSLALQLWYSRFGHEDLDEGWYEVGAMYLLKHNLPVVAQRLANHDIPRDRMSLKLATCFLDAWSRRLKRYNGVSDVYDAAVYSYSYADRVLKFKEYGMLSEQKDNMLFEQAARSVIAAGMWPAAEDFLKHDSVFTSIDMRMAFRAAFFQFLRTEGEEEYFMPFFQQLVEKCPGLALQPIATAAIIVALSRSKRFEDAAALLEVSKSKNQKFPWLFRRAITRAFEESTLAPRAQELLAALK